MGFQSSAHPDFIVFFPKPDGWHWVVNSVSIVEAAIDAIAYNFPLANPKVRVVVIDGSGTGPHSLGLEALLHECGAEHTV